MMKKPSFSEIVKRESLKNGEKLMSKARSANHVAKASKGASRASAYKVKTSLLETLIQKLPHKVRVHRDIRLDDFVVVALRDGGLGLHFPSERFQGHVHRSMN